MSMISPYVRRLRLAGEIRALRAEAGLTADQLGRRIGRSRADISRLENGHVVDQADVISILDALAVGGDRWTQIVTIAREASEDGWWKSQRAMGDRQALYANLEAGATSIVTYEQTFLPGLLQIPEFVRARVNADAILEPATTSTVEAVLAGNAGRQRMFRRPGGPTLDVIVDEMAVRRLTAPHEIVKKQLYHLASAVNGDPKVTLRVLPVDARIENFTVPRCTFWIFTYPDPGDPAVVVIDTVTSDLILTEPAQVAPYDQLFQRLRAAALPPADSLDLLTKAATELPDR
jgi:transcriptional regulator with XRE-family HTH domain